MKRLLNFVLILRCGRWPGLVAACRLVPWLPYSTVPASKSLIAALPGFADALHKPEEPQPAGGGSKSAQRNVAPVPVVLAQAVAKQMPMVIDAVGTATPYASIQIRTRLDNTTQWPRGNVAEGSEVKQGDILFTLDDRAIKAQVAQIEAQIARDQAQIAQAQIDLSRANDLLARNAGAATTPRYGCHRSQGRAGSAPGRPGLAGSGAGDARLYRDPRARARPHRLDPVKPGSTVRASDTSRSPP